MEPFNFMLPKNEDLGRSDQNFWDLTVASKVYAPQTKIWEGVTKEEIRISKEALFNGS